MPREPREDTFFDLLPTPSVGTRAVRLWVRQEFLRAGTSITTGTTVQAFVGTLNVQAGDVLTAGYGSYVLTAPGPADGRGYLAFDFGPPAASLALASLTPWSEKTIWENDFSWPPVLRYLLANRGTAKELTEDGESISGSTTTTTTNARTRILYVDQFELVPGVRVPTQVIVRRYLTPGLITGLKAERPIPTPVRYSYLTMQNSIECLHDDVIVPELLDNPRRLSGFGTKNGIERDQGGQLIPRTNFLTWLPHIYRIDQDDQPRNGLYETTVYEAQPPVMPRAHKLVG
jgi:hypothetical protein